MQACTKIAAGLVCGVLAVALTGCSEPKEMGVGNEKVLNHPEAFTGHCHCGKVAYKVAPPVTKASECGCPGCRRASGTFAVPFVTVPPDQYVLTEGELATYEMQGGQHCDKHGVWHFCPNCGTQMYWTDHKRSQIDIFAGTLDDPSIHKKNLKGS